MNNITLPEITKFPEFISLFDSDENTGLRLFSYRNCENNSPDFVKQSRGLVFNANDELVTKSLPFTPEFNSHNKDDLNLLSSTCNDISNFRFFPSLEGTILRLFWYKKWYLSTNKKLDAYKSKWSSNKSFGELFVESLESEMVNMDAYKDRLVTDKYEVDLNLTYCDVQLNETITNSLELLCANLETDKSYIFLLTSNSQNRIVSNSIFKQKIYHICTLHNTQNKLIFDIDDNIGLPKSKELFFESFNEAVDYVNNIDVNEYQGLIICRKDEFKQYKLLNNKYIDLFNLRNNVSNIRYRYLQLRGDEHTKNLFIELYKDRKNIFDDCEERIRREAAYIFKSYKGRFINKLFISVPKSHYVVVKECHEWHLLDKSKNKVSFDFVLNTLENIDTTILYRILYKNN